MKVFHPEGNSSNIIGIFSDSVILKFYFDGGVLDIHVYNFQLPSKVFYVNLIVHLIWICQRKSGDS